MKQEALKLALEALEGVLDDAPKVLEASIAGGLYEVVQCRDAITAIKEALAQQEPDWGAVGEAHLVSLKRDTRRTFEDAAMREIERLREDQQGVDAVDTLTEEGWIWDGDQWQRPAEPEQKPMHPELRKMWEDHFDKCFAESASLYTTPPQRTWVGLTDEEIWETISRIGTSDSNVNPYAKLADARAIEFKLRSKNT